MQRHAEKDIWQSTNNAAPCRLGFVAGKMQRHAEKAIWQCTRKCMQRRVYGRFVSRCKVMQRKFYGRREKTVSCREMFVTGNWMQRHAENDLWQQVDEESCREGSMPVCREGFIFLPCNN